MQQADADMFRVCFKAKPFLRMATATPLLQDFELQESNSEIPITSEAVKQNYHMNKTNLDTKSTELLQILGGIDHILQFYLSHPDSLNNTQLTQINDIIVSNANTTPNEDCNKQMEKSTCINIDTLELSKSDTFLHLILKDSTATKIINFLFSKPMGVCIAVLLICFIIDYIAGVETVPTYQWPLELIANLLLIMLLLSVNKLLFRRTMFTFEFIIKVFYAIRLFMCKILEPGKADIPEHIGDCNYILLVTTISLVDGLQMRRKVKIILVALVSALYSSYAIQYTFFEDLDVVKIFDTWKLDLTSWQASSYRVIALFSWAQTYRLLSGANISTMIAKPLNIEWLDT